MENERRASGAKHRANWQTFAEDGCKLQQDVVMVTAVTSTVTNTALQF
jgi:hypothetical protein